MTITKDTAALRITSELRDAESALDHALLTQSRLLTEMISARIETGADTLAGQAEIMRLIKAQQSVTSSANDLARVHGGLLDIGREEALIQDCPEPGPMRGQVKAA